MKLISFLNRYKLVISIISFGVGIRLFFAFSFNHLFDYFNILVLSKSVADTNSLLEGFFVLKNAINHESQLFGKIYYQVIAAWLYLLDAIKVVDIDFIFDTKPYDPKTPYMSGFGQWGPLHYQITAIKLIQFLYEGIFLFFFLSTIRLIKRHSYNALIIGALFWTLNPFMIYATYVPFQSDLAMTSFLLGGVYFGIKILSKKEKRITSKEMIMMSACFAIGAIIKQVPILFIIPFLILLTPSVKSFFLNSAIFAAFYYVISQPFSSDTLLMKTFFLTSEESTALFNFTLNNASFMIMIYGLALILIFINRTTIRKNPFNLLRITIILLSMIYISEDIPFLYAQFNIWIMPFLILMAFLDPIFAVFLLVPIIGFYRWIIIDNGAMTGSMMLTFGSALDNIPSFESLLNAVLQPKLIHRFINSFFILGHAIIIYYSIKYWNNSKVFITKLPLIWIPIIIVSIYICFFTYDFLVRSNLAQVTNFKYFDTHDQLMTTAPITFTVRNNNRRAISGIEIALMRKSIQKSDFVVLEAFDEKGSVLVHKEVNDYTIPNGFGEFYIPFGNNLKNKKIKIQISKKYGQNQILIQQADTSSYESSYERYYGHYDSFYDSKPVTLSFPNEMYKVNVLGKYSLGDMFMNFKNHFYQRPIFYYVYLTLTFVTLLGGGILSGILLYKNKKLLNENT